MKLLLIEPKLRGIILIPPFRATGDIVLSRFGANVTHCVDTGTAEQKAQFLNAMSCKAQSMP